MLSDVCNIPNKMPHKLDAGRPIHSGSSKYCIIAGNALNYPFDEETKSLEKHTRNKPAHR